MNPDFTVPVKTTPSRECAELGVAVKEGVKAPAAEPGIGRGLDARDIGEEIVPSMATKLPKLPCGYV